MILLSSGIKNLSWYFASFIIVLCKNYYSCNSISTFKLSINNNISNYIIILINKIRDNRINKRTDSSIQSQSFVLSSLFGEEGASFSKRNWTIKWLKSSHLTTATSEDKK